MVKTTLIFLMFLVLIINDTQAQEIIFTGKLQNKDNHSPIANSSLAVYNTNDIVYQTVSDSLGIFKIPAIHLKQGTVIKIHALSYEDIEIYKSQWGDNIARNKFYLGEFNLKPQNISLEDVIVKLKKRYRDTTKIDLSNTKFERSITITDLFSKDYGFTKDANGQLYYKGKIISDVVVNGGDFFDKNNLDIYNLLPALILDHIDVVETNIDSATNTTTLKPALTVNLNLKEKYNKGKFGNINLGVGSSKRYVANTNLYSYKNKEQISLFINKNNINIGDNTLQEPKVSFSSNGNNLTTNSARFTYKNLFVNKLETSFDINAKIENRKNRSESEIQDNNINVFSKTLNVSYIKTFNINNGKLQIHYKIDSLSYIIASQNYSHSNVDESDSLNYNIQLNNLTKISQLQKTRSFNSDFFKTKADYQKKYDSKKGRTLNIGIELNNNIYEVNEIANAFTIDNQNASNYFINGTRSAKEKSYIIKSDFTEPLGETGYLNFSFNYEHNNLSYSPKVETDTILNNIDFLSYLANDYFRWGAKFQKTFDKFSFDINLTGILDIRNIKQKYNSIDHFFDLNSNLKFDYRINSKKEFSINYTNVTNYPDVKLLTSLNNTFDLISQTNGNIYLKPEQKKSIKISYNARLTDSENISLAGEFNHYNQKFGTNIQYAVDQRANNILQNSFTDNIKSSNEGQISFSFLKNLTDTKYLNLTSVVSYKEIPTLFNGTLLLNNSLTFNQTVTTSINIIKSLLKITPLFSSSYSKYFYAGNNFNITTLTYSDKLSIGLKSYKLELYPLINYNHSINNTASFSMNGAIKKDIFKNYGLIWIQAYDIFNSFKYINNYVGPSSYQSVKYSNLTRYIIVGLSFKLNNMK